MFGEAAYSDIITNVSHQSLIQDQEASAIEIAWAANEARVLAASARQAAAALAAPPVIPAPPVIRTKWAGVYHKPDPLRLSDGSPVDVVQTVTPPPPTAADLPVPIAAPAPMTIPPPVEVPVIITPPIVQTPEVPVIMAPPEERGRHRSRSRNPSTKVEKERNPHPVDAEIT